MIAYLNKDCRLSYNNFSFQRDGAPTLAHRTRHTVAYLRSHVPEFIELDNWPPNNPNLNPVDYSVWGVATDDNVVAKFQTFRYQLNCMLIDCWAQQSQVTTHIKSSYRLAAKRLMMVINVRVSCWILSGLAVCANDRCCFTVCSVKIEQNPWAIVKFGVISRGVNIYAN